jgi:predicted ABC-type ATPase
MPSLYVIGGANGSGKTTLALTLLPRFLQVFEYAMQMRLPLVFPR